MPAPAFWAGDTDINSCSIGIEIANPGHDYGYPEFPKRQIAAVTALCRGIQTRNTIPPARVLAHSDVAPSRKQDPGEKFPWRTLHDSGVGHWVESGPDHQRRRGARARRSQRCRRAMQQSLIQYGYGLAANSIYDSATHDVVRPSSVISARSGSTASAMNRRAPLCANLWRSAAG
jgi:N-acetylmuramoyl-L-alanine amidase